MKHLALALLLVAAWAAVVVAAHAPFAPVDTPQGSASAGGAALPSGAVELLSATPFTVDVPFVHEWRAEQPLVAGGWLLVLQVDAELARTKETVEPVLYVGDQTAERCSYHSSDGRIVVLVPSAVDAQGRVALDVEHAPIWFGSLELPERVDAARIAQELALARAASIGPVRKHTSFRARAAGADAIHVRTRGELAAYVEDLGGELR